MEVVGLFHQSVSPREHRHSLGKDYDAKLVPNNLFYKREFKIGEKHKRKRDVEECRREERINYSPGQTPLLSLKLCGSS